MERVKGHRAIRQSFVATLIAIELESEKQIAGRTRDLSLFGCYVETPTPFVREGTGVVFTSVDEREHWKGGWID